MTLYFTILYRRVSETSSPASQTVAPRRVLPFSPIFRKGYDGLIRERDDHVRVIHPITNRALGVTLVKVRLRFLSLRCCFPRARCNFSAPAPPFLKMTRNCGSDSRENEFSFCSHVQNPVFVLFPIRCPRAIGSISFFRLALAVSLCLVSFSLSCTYFEVR